MDKNEAMSSSNPLQTKSNYNAESRTEVCTVAPKHPKYQTYISRLESFDAWPIRYVPKTPEQLASAGFFYIGSADRVTCFQCGITLRDWDKEHDPVAEHQRYSAHCHFMKRLQEQERRAGDKSVGPPSSNTDETNGVSQRRAADTPETNNTVSNFLCLDIKKQLKLIVEFFSSDPVVKQDQTPQDVSALEVRVSTLKQSGEDCATLLKTTAQNEKNDPESMFPCNAHVRNRGTRKQLGLCRLCKKKDVSVMFLPCGHFVACKSCANKVDICMMCKMDIRERTDAAEYKSPVQ